MNEFSFGGAWSKGAGLFSGRGSGHALILIGLGIVTPFIIQYALIGEATSMTNPFMLAGGGGAALAGGIMAAVMAATYVLQTGSYFGSWRLGLGERENVAGAALYGLLAGLLVVVGAALVMGLIGFTFMMLVPPVGAVLIFVLFLLLFAMLYTVVAALVGVALFLVLALAMILGVSMGQIGAAATLTGGSGAVAVVLLVACVILLWLTARLSCTTAVMADRKSFNPVAAMGESWRLTTYDQFKIMAYLGLIGIVLTVILVIGGGVVGVAMVSAFQGGAPPALGLGAVIIGLIVAIPFAYLTVLVPGGIYREVAGSTVSAEVFA